MSYLPTSRFSMQPWEHILVFVFNESRIFFRSVDNICVIEPDAMASSEIHRIGCPSTTVQLLHWVSIL